MISGLALSIFGFSSSILLGWISDVFEKRSYMIKSLVIIAGNTLSIPLMATIAFTQNFWLAIVC